jgi:ubiquitin conjugation factor E4 B
VYLKDVAQELDEEEPCTLIRMFLRRDNDIQTHTEPLVTAATSRPRPLRIDLADRLLLARLSLSPSNMNDDDFEMATVLASLPANETAFEYLGGCWRRERAERFKVVAKKVRRPPSPDGGHTLTSSAWSPQDSDAAEAQKRLAGLAEIKALLVSYIGLVLQDPSMFPQDHIS